MIRKLKSGEYRLYSRKQDPKTGKRRNLGTFKTLEPPSSTSAPCSTSSGTDDPPAAPGGLGLSSVEPWRVPAAAAAAARCLDKGGEASV